jgi:hypothetical protein
MYFYELNCHQIVIIKMSDLQPDYPILTGNEAKNAVATQITYFPQVVRSAKDECIESQQSGLVSFMWLKEPRKTKNGKNIYGFFKLRGNWRDENQATAKASRIVREQDSKYPLRVAPVGIWFPLSDDEAMINRNININTEEEENPAREAAQREEEDKKKKIMREIKEREEEVKTAKDYNEDKESIDFYTMKMVVWMRLQESIEIQRKKLKELEDKLLETRSILSGLDKTHTSFNEDWIDNYNKERRKAGIPDYVPGEAEMRIYRDSDPNPIVNNNNL